MCHSCESRKPGLFLRQQESGLLWAYSCGPDGQAGMLGYFLDSRFRGNDTAPPASFRSQPSSPAGGDAGCFTRLKCYEKSSTQTVNETASPRQKPGANHRFAILEYKEGTPWKNTSNSLVCNKLWQKTGVSVYSLSKVFWALKV